MMHAGSPSRRTAHDRFADSRRGEESYACPASSCGRPAAGYGKPRSNAIRRGYRQGRRERSGSSNGSRTQQTPSTIERRQSSRQFECQHPPGTAVSVKPGDLRSCRGVTSIRRDGGQPLESSFVAVQLLHLLNSTIGTSGSAVSLFRGHPQPLKVVFRQLEMSHDLPVQLGLRFLELVKRLSNLSKFAFRFFIVKIPRREAFRPGRHPSPSLNLFSKRLPASAGDRVIPRLRGCSLFSPRFLPRSTRITARDAPAPDEAYPG